MGETGQFLRDVASTTPDVETVPPRGDAEPLEQLGGGRSHHPGEHREPMTAIGTSVEHVVLSVLVHRINLACSKLSCTDGRLVRRHGAARRRRSALTLGRRRKRASHVVVISKPLPETDLIVNAARYEH
jgi:hypothetical protein